MLLYTALSNNLSRTLRAWILSFSLRFKWSTPALFSEAFPIKAPTVYKVFDSLVKARFLSKTRAGQFVIFRPTLKAYNLAEFYNLQPLPSYKTRTYLANFSHALEVRRQALITEANANKAGLAISLPGHLVGHKMGIPKSIIPDFISIMTHPEGEWVRYLLGQVETGTRNPKSIKARMRKELLTLPSTLAVAYIFPHHSKTLRGRYARYFEELKESLPADQLEDAPPFRFVTYCTFSDFGPESPVSNLETFRKGFTYRHTQFILQVDPLNP